MVRARTKMLIDDGDTLYAKMMWYHSAETGYATVRNNTKISTALHCQVYVSFTPCAHLGFPGGQGLHLHVCFHGHRVPWSELLSKSVTPGHDALIQGSQTTAHGPAACFSTQSFIGTWLHLLLYIPSAAASTLRQQSSAVATETIAPISWQHVFTLWSFKQKFTDLSIGLSKSLSHT